MIHSVRCQVYFKDFSTGRSQSRLHRERLGIRMRRWRSFAEGYGLCKAAEKLYSGSALYQGTTSELIRKLTLGVAPVSRPAVLAASPPPAAMRGSGDPHDIRPGGRRYLFTDRLSVVPQATENRRWASAPAGCSELASPQISTFSAACLPQAGILIQADQTTGRQ
jgi:hypothetical protein